MMKPDLERIEQAIEGGTVDPADVRALIARVRSLEQRRTNEAAKPHVDWSTVTKTCPKCWRELHVLPDFGLKKQRGVIGAQSWCHACRSKTNYTKRPRKNRTKNNP
jgi:hypothetical protein